MSTVRLYPLLLLALFTGCTSGTAPDARILTGHWATEPEAHRPSGSMQYHLVLGRDRRFSREVRSYGVYQGQAAVTLSAYSRDEGQFEVLGDSIVFRPERRIWWDSFYRVAEPTIEELTPSDRLSDGATFRVRLNRLTLSYLTFPLDAPVPTQKTFRRAN
ncbi:hypothetical protein BH23GEM8_BH23GEM8_18620 [soil metagenome]